jgi:hypothetical protein
VEEEKKPLMLDYKRLILEDKVTLALRLLCLHTEHEMCCHVLHSGKTFLLPVPIPCAFRTTGQLA